MAAFGATTAELNAMEDQPQAPDLVMAEWVQDQMNLMSSHREYYRKRLSPRAVESYENAIMGRNPCKANSHWRRFAFTKANLELSQTGISKMKLRVQQVESDSGAWS